jgi:hypothetical protein
MIIDASSAQGEARLQLNALMMQEPQAPTLSLLDRRGIGRDGEVADIS